LAEAAVDEATRPGVAFTYKSYWPKRSASRTNVNATTDERDTDLGGGPSFHDNRVEVTRAGDAKKNAAARLASKRHPEKTRSAS
jgi:anaerobic selenocysteine-containing dehydrogenase